MLNAIKILLPTIGASAVLAACGGSSYGGGGGSTASSSHAASSANVRTASNSRLRGTVLVTGQGLTLYRLSGERAGKFICTSTACTQLWHPLTVSPGTKPSGSVSSLSVVKRPDGSEQVTYKGMPLYTFAR